MVLAAVSWTSLFGLAIARTLAQVDGITIWAVLLGQVATILTGWLILEHIVEGAREAVSLEIRELDEQAVERVALRLAEALRDNEGNVSSLR